MRPVTKRALVSSVVTALLATASILPGSAAMASDDVPTSDTAETAASQPVAPEASAENATDGGAADAQESPQNGESETASPQNEAPQAGGNRADDAAAQPNTAGNVATDEGPGAENQGNVAPQPSTPAENAAVSEPAATTPAPEKTLYEVHLGFANWDFKRSFRDYVGSEHEDRIGVRELSEGKNLVWYPKMGQSIDVKTPTTLKLGGEVHWLKYGGILDVKISNPTIDFTNKKLLVDASTKGTLAGGGPKTFTQQPLLDLQDLTWEMRDGYLVIASHAPRITAMSKELVGFYHGEVGDPLVATIQLRGTNAKAPDPVLWKIFPDRYKNPGNKPLVDPNEAVVDVNVPDAALAHCIRWELDLPEATPITNKVIQTLQSMQCIGINKTDEQKIRSLKGLEGAKNLASIKFAYNAINDLTPLAGLNRLHTVELNDNAITDLSPLAELTKLETLRVSNNAITAIPNFKKLENLGTIEAANNKIKDISGLPVGSENLRILDFANNRIEDISALGDNPHSRELYFNDNRISDVTPLKRMRAMQKINVANNFITDPATFATWPAANQDWFTSLHVSGNRFSDWSVLDSLGTKVKDRPAAGQEAQAMNPRTLEEALAADKKADEPQTPAPPQTDTPKKYSAELHWGVRKSFRNYLTNPALAKGKWILSNGAKEGFIFPLADGATISRETLSKIDFKGGVRFLGHKGNLDLSIVNPTVVNEQGAWKLVADVASRPVPENLFAAPEVGADTPPPPSKRVTLATLDGLSMERGATSTYKFATVTLTEEGDRAFGGFYGADNRAMDPLSIVVSEVASPTPDPKDQTPGDTKPGDTAPGDTTPGDTKPGDTAPGDTTPGDTKPGDTAPGGTKPGTDAPADPRPKALTADLNWGIRKSFLDYVTGPIAHGAVEVSEGVTGRFVFPLAAGKTLPHGDFTGAEFAGKVRFTGHGGLLDLTIANPAIVRDGQAWKLMADVASRPFSMPGARPGTSLRAASTSADVPAPERVHLANLGGMTLTRGKDGARVAFSSVELTEEGAKAFGGFYAAGNRALDALTVTLRPADAPKPAPGEQPQDAPKDAPKDAPQGGKPTDAPSTKAPQQNKAPAAGGSQTAKPQKKECTVDPNRTRVTSGSLSWGVRSSFTTYVRGSIAKGGWDLNGVNWDGSTFNFPASGGLYNASTGSGTIYYSGTVHFHGHNGILDLTMSNPAVEINGKSGTLYLTVAGSDTSGKKFDLGRVAFATLGFNGVNASDKALSFEGASVTLTDAGAKAFAGFYKAGTSLDPMSSSLNVTAATACDPETGELIEYDAFGGVTAGGSGAKGLASTGAEAQTLVWMSLVALALGAAALRASGLRTSAVSTARTRH